MCERRVNSLKLDGGFAGEHCLDPLSTLVLDTLVRLWTTMSS